MSESEEGRRQLRKEYVKRGAKLAGFHGEIKVTIELESGGVGESTAEEVLKRMVDRLMEDVALLPTIRGLGHPQGHRDLRALQVGVHRALPVRVG